MSKTKGLQTTSDQSTMQDELDVQVVYTKIGKLVEGHETLMAKLDMLLDQGQKAAATTEQGQANLRRQTTITENDFAALIQAIASLREGGGIVAVTVPGKGQRWRSAGAGQRSTSGIPNLNRWEHRATGSRQGGDRRGRRQRSERDGGGAACQLP
ncbi:unnamed protein product [Linum trigynum]|uniref:Uncharacterized protein n=1 Tax=Linum trigynum TaxID=586398 RepID=A0AAV2GU52_9ROSI